MSPHRRWRLRPISAFLLLLGISLAIVMPASASVDIAVSASESGLPEWSWPFEGPIAASEPFRAPAHAYGAGHRGIDVTATVDAEVRAPADGVVAFRGVVVDRPLLTIDHADGYVSTFEPMNSALSPGDLVVRGDVIGTVASGGHSTPGSVHLGVRLDDAYIDPMLLFGKAERAVLLPCCGPL